MPVVKRNIAGVSAQPVVAEKFNRFGCDDLSRRALIVLNEVFGDEGLIFVAGGGRFNEDIFTMKINVKRGVVHPGETKPVAVEPAFPPTQPDETFRLYAPRLGLEIADFGRSFMSSNTQYVIFGVKPGRHKYPVQAYRLYDKRRFKFGVDTVLRGLGRGTALYETR